MKKLASKILEALLVELLIVLIAIFIDDRFSQLFLIVIGTVLACSLAVNPNISKEKSANSNIDSSPQTPLHTTATTHDEINLPALMWVANPFVIFVQWVTALVLGNVLWNAILLPTFLESLPLQPLLGSLYDLSGALITGFVIGVFQWSIINTNTFLPKRWIALTAISYGVVDLVYLFIYSFPSSIWDYWFSSFIFFAIGGFIVGATQSFVFGKIFGGFITWIIACALGWGISGFAEYLWFDHLSTSSILLGGILSGLLDGLVSGIVVAYFVRSKIGKDGKIAPNTACT